MYKSKKNNPENTRAISCEKRTSYVTGKRKSSKKLDLLNHSRTYYVINDSDIRKGMLVANLTVKEKVFFYQQPSSSSYSVFILCFPFSRDGRIYPIPSAISRTPSLHLSRLRASSFFKPTFSVSSSTCFFQVFQANK